MRKFHRVLVSVSCGCSSETYDFYEKVIKLDYYGNISFYRLPFASFFLKVFKKYDYVADFGCGYTQREEFYTVMRSGKMIPAMMKKV